MRRRIGIICGMVVLVVLLTGVLASAVDMKGKIGFGGYGGYSLLKPAGFNQVLNEIKEYYESWLYFGPNSGTIKPLNSGILYRGEIRYGVASNLMLGAGYSKMSGSGQVNWDNGWAWTGEYKATLSVTGITASLLFAMGGESSNFYFGGGAGWYSGTITRTASSDPAWVCDFYDKIVYQGKSTVGFHGIAGFEFFLSSNVAIGIEGMYSLVKFPPEWTIKEHPDSYWVGETSTIWTNAVQAGGITIGGGLHFYIP